MISPEILRRYPYFAAAKDEGLRDLAMLCEEELIPAGTVMYREGDKADKLYHPGRRRSRHSVHAWDPASCGPSIRSCPAS